MGISCLSCVVEALRIGKRGRPKKTLPKGVKVRIKNKGSQRHKRGPKRPKYQAPYPEHPDTPPACCQRPIFMPIIWKPSIRR